MVIVCFLQEVNHLFFGERDIATNKRAQTSNGTDRVPPMSTRRMTDFQKIPVLSPVLDKGASQTSRTHSSLHSLVKHTSALDTHLTGPNFDILIRLDNDAD